MLDSGYRSQAYASAAAARPRRRNHYPNLERLICAAVSNARLAAMLVQAPAQALTQFEVGRLLTPAECRLVSRIVGAQDIHEFAGRLHALLTQLQRFDTDELVPEHEEEANFERRSTASTGFRATPATTPVRALMLAHYFR
jgi:hypothetical protein